MNNNLKASGIPLEYAEKLGIAPLTDGSGYYFPYRFWDSGKAMFGDGGKPFGRTKTQSGEPKYYQRTGSGVRPYVIPEAGEYYHKRLKALIYLTEGEKKAIAATIHGFPLIALGGIWNWVDKKDRKYGKRLHYTIASWLKGRSKAIMIFDSDGIVKNNFYKCAQMLAAALIPYGVDLYIAFVPSISQTSKTGIDDWLVANNFDALRLKQIIDETAQKVRCIEPWNINIPPGISSWDISESEYRLLYVISKCAKENGQYSGWCEASKEYLAAATGKSRTHTIRLKKALTDTGYLIAHNHNYKLLKLSEKARLIFQKNIETIMPETRIMSKSVTCDNVTLYPQDEKNTIAIPASKCNIADDVTQYMNGGQKERVNREGCSEQKISSPPLDRKAGRTYAWCHCCQADRIIKWKPESERSRDYTTWFKCEICGSDKLSFYMMKQT